MFIPCLNDNEDHIKLLEYLIKKIYKLMNIIFNHSSTHLITVISWMAGLLYICQESLFTMLKIMKKKKPLKFSRLWKKVPLLHYETSNVSFLDFWNCINFLNRFGFL